MADENLLMRSSPIEMKQKHYFSRHIFIATDNILSTGKRGWKKWSEGLEDNPKSKVLCKDARTNCSHNPHLFSLKRDISASNKQDNQLQTNYMDVQITFFYKQL